MSCPLTLSRQTNLFGFLSAGATDRPVSRDADGICFDRIAVGSCQNDEERTSLFNTWSSTNKTWTAAVLMSSCCPVDPNLMPPSSEERTRTVSCSDPISAVHPTRRHMPFSVTTRRTKTFLSRRMFRPRPMICLTIAKSDNTFKVLIDNKSVRKGNWKMASQYYFRRRLT